MYPSNQRMEHHQVSKGRRKIPIATIGDKNKKHVTFSKRRLGLFKKASELCVLCGADLAIIAFSEVGKVFCFGHPTAESVIQRYLGLGAGTTLITSSSNSSSISLATSPTSPNNSQLPPTAAARMLLDQQQPPDCNIININSHNQIQNTDQGTGTAGIVMNKYIKDYEHVKKRIEQEKKNASSSSAVGNIGTTPTNCNNNNKLGEFWWEEPVDELDLPELEQFLASLQDLRKNVAMKADEFSMHVFQHPRGYTSDADRHHHIINSSGMVDQRTSQDQDQDPDPLASFNMLNSDFGGSGFTFT
ncbi:hypothetical protein Ancab_002665 [Ancistrocladus abbreviatus]